MFCPKIGDYVLLCNGKVAKEVLPDLPQVDLDSLRPGDKIRLASGRIQTVKRIEVDGTPYHFGVITENSCLFYHVTGRQWNSTGSNPFNIVEILPQVDLHTLKAGDTVELASGATKEIKSVAYNSILRSVQVVFTTCKSTLPWNYQRDGAEPYFPMDSIVKIIPKPKLDFSINTVDLTTLKEGDTVHLSDRSTAEVVSVASKMLGTVYVIRLRRFGLNRYCVDGCSLDKDKPSIVRIVDTSTAKERGAEILRQSRGRALRDWLAMPGVEISFGIDPAALPNVFDEAEVNLQTLQPGDTVELANGKTEKVGRIAYGSPQNPFRVYFADDGCGWFYSASGNCAGVEGRIITRIIPQPKPSPTLALEMSPDGRFITSRITVRGTGATAATVRSKPKLNLYTLEPGAVVTLANGNTKEVLQVDLQSRAHENHICITFADGVWIYNPDGTRPPGRDSAYNIVGVSQSNHQTEPTSLIVNGHIVKPGDVLTRANGDRIVVNKITPKPCGNWKVWHSAYGGCFFEVDSSGRCHLSPGLSITGVAPNQTVPQGQPGTRMTLERLTQLVEQRPSAFTEIAQFTGRSVTDLLSDLEKGLSAPWPKPITTPPTKKDADPLGQVAVLDKDTDWMKQEWWAARDMLAAGNITGWAHTQAWHDASDPWN